MAGGVAHWINPTNIYTSNNAYAVNVLMAGQKTHWLRATTFGFTIPDGATIDGIKAEVEKKAGSAGMIRDESVKIVKAGSEQGNDKFNPVFWTTTDTYISYGGAADLWGLGWTVANINAANFGVSLSAYYPAGDFPVAASVDHIRITVYYTEVALTNMKINIGDSWKDVDEIKINVGDSWKTVTRIQINIGDVWKTIFG
ncbi:hypothetical protein ES702_07520 [subsurface metagenome]